MRGLKKVLVAEDEGSIREFITLNLAKAGYNVSEAKNGAEAMELFDREKDSFDIVLLDVMMPFASGIDACRHIREKSQNVGVIFLSAKAQEQDKVYGLYCGADDYITKPFSVTELLARIDSVYRRVRLSKELLSAYSDEITCGSFVLSTKKRAVFCGRQRIDLCLLYTSPCPGKTVSREELLTQVWGESYYGDDKVVDVNIRRLRLKIEKDPSCPEHLITVWGKGYKWVAD